MDHFIFIRGLEEVARAQVMPVAVIDPSLFTGHPIPTQIVSIERINVHQDLRLEDIGREAVSALIEHYGDAQLGAFALDGPAERFWMRIGWTAFRRRPGERGDPLFCSP
ncbi:hypothetical protein ES689_14175 [Frigoribacterium sp. ACAM 257]|uniref:hypothetical protein n=1 Tax=Frigoribacterium sp. ACAM 257 TaxID=2508998 RepID=UPI0011B95B55|nr:hypothetical protein [Frigoribacterium sp. ACAM 257]TWX34986.1 hypothetical protein ES689_14175 [Frigoribacterium sp. ACAM 257]